MTHTWQWRGKVEREEADNEGLTEIGLSERVSEKVSE